MTAPCWFLTVVLYVSGLLLRLVLRHTVDFYSYQRVDDRAFFFAQFGKLLTTYDLKGLYKH